MGALYSALRQWMLSQRREFFDGLMNGEAFRARVEQFLAPTLREGDIVVMDNLSSHKMPGVKEAIEEVGRACAIVR